MQLIMRITLAVLGFALTLSLAPHGMAAAWEKQTAANYTLPDPPDESETAQEIIHLLKLQRERTKSECTLGQRQRTPGFKNLFSSTPLLSAKDIQILTPLMKRVSALGEKISQSFKNRYQRTRPYDIDSQLQPCVTRPGGKKSYPSSHATVSTVDACILAVILPVKQQGFHDLAIELSERRMKIGVHFPSDVRAGANLGIAICNNLAADSEFMTEVEAIRKAL